MLSCENFMNKVFNPNKMSAKLFIDYARTQLLDEDQLQNANDKDVRLKRFLLLYDLYIKARSYAIMNKVTFCCAVIFGILVLLWPSITIVSKDFGWEKEFLKSAVVQTTITGLAALTFAVYSHYKKRQLFTENLMRFALFSKDSIPDLAEKIIHELLRIDTGFSFSQTIFKKTKAGGEEMQN